MTNQPKNLNLKNIVSEALSLTNLIFHSGSTTSSFTHDTEKKRNANFYNQYSIPTILPSCLEYLTSEPDVAK